MTRRSYHDERGITSPVSYTLTIAMAMLLVTGLVYAGSAQVEQQREATARAQLDVVGQQVAANLEAADRMVRASENPSSLTLTIDRRLPSEAVGTGYSVEIDSANDAVVVSSPVLDDDVRVPYHVSTSVLDSNFDGGQITISHTGSALEVTG